MFLFYISRKLERGIVEVHRERVCVSGGFLFRVVVRDHDVFFSFLRLVNWG